MNEFKNIVFTGEYLVCIEGKYDLEQINLQISSEEASFSRFLRCKISRNGSGRLNFVVFRELLHGNIPEEPYQHIDLFNLLKPTDLPNCRETQSIELILSSHSLYMDKHLFSHPNAAP